MKIALIYDINHIDTVHTDNDWVHTYYLTFVIRYFSSNGYMYNEECTVGHAIRKEALSNMYNTENPIEYVLNQMIHASKNEARCIRVGKYLKTSFKVISIYHFSRIL